MFSLMSSLATLATTLQQWQGVQVKTSNPPSPSPLPNAPTPAPHIHTPVRPFPSSTLLFSLVSCQNLTFLLSSPLLWSTGDQTNNLMWRLLHGEVFHKNPPKVTVVMIGTNDLSAVGCTAGESGISAAAGGVVSRWCLTSADAQ